VISDRYVLPSCPADTNRRWFYRHDAAPWPTPHHTTPPGPGSGGATPGGYDSPHRRPRSHAGILHTLPAQRIGGGEAPPRWRAGRSEKEPRAPKNVLRAFTDRCRCLALDRGQRYIQWRSRRDRGGGIRGLGRSQAQAIWARPNQMGQTPMPPSPSIQNLGHCYCRRRCSAMLRTRLKPTVNRLSLNWKEATVNNAQD
jgi:hypothetical protein